MRKLLGKAGVLAFVVGSGAAMAEVPAEVNTMFTTFQADALTVIGSGAVLMAAVVGGWLIVKFAKKIISGAK